MPINETDYVELYVGNAKQAAHFYKTAFGFQDLVYAGLETGLRDRTSYVLQQGKIKLVLTTPLDNAREISQHLQKHGDGVKVIALWVNDAYDAYEQTGSRGAIPYLLPETIEDKYGIIRQLGIHTYGETVHIFIERKNYKGIFLPGYEKLETTYHPTSTGLTYIDHMVGNVELGAMNYWANFYGKVMGFANLVTFDDKDISTEYTALMSTSLVYANEFSDCDYYNRGPLSYRYYNEYKPFFFGESGEIVGAHSVCGMDIYLDQYSDRGFHNSLWSSLFMGNAVGTLNWTDWPAMSINHKIN